MSGVLMARVMADDTGLAERLERERSRMTHQVFLLAESGMLPSESERRGFSRAATARAWATHVGASLGHVWPPAPADLGDRIDTWFAANGERLEVIELALAERVASGPVSDLATRERRVDYGAASRWLMEAIGAICDPDGSGGPAFARRMSGLLDAAAEGIGASAAERRAVDPDDDRLAETAELMAHVEATVAALESALPLSAGPAPAA